MAFHLSPLHRNISPPSNEQRETGPRCENVQLYRPRVLGDQRLAGRCRVVLCKYLDVLGSAVNREQGHLCPGVLW